MCRSSCCKNSGSGEGAAFAAIAIIIICAAVAAKIAPIVARAVHLVIEIIKIAALTGGALMAGTAIGWLSIAIIRWQLRHRASPPVVIAAKRETVAVIPDLGQQPDCLACGDKGTVLRAITGSRYEPSPCPVCQPVREARR